MTNIIEESKIINRLLSPYTVSNTSSPHPHHPQQIEIQIQQIVSKNTSRNLLNLSDQQSNLDNPNSDSENVVNPMSSFIDISEAEKKENNLDLDVKQVLTEINEQQPPSYQNLDSIEFKQDKVQEVKQPLKNLVNDNKKEFYDQIARHKYIMIKQNLNNTSQKKESPTDQTDILASNNQITATFHELLQQDSDLIQQKHLKQINDSLKEIYQFYSKQAVTTNDYKTFEKLQHLQNTITLQKFMLFCKDFSLIDLEINEDLIQKLGGKISEYKKRKNQFKFNHKNSFILNKFQLVEIYKKNATKQMELSLETFKDTIKRIATTIFLDLNCLEMLYQYLGLPDHKIYRKKMTLIGKPFYSKEYSEIVTQEMLYQRKIILPPRKRIESTNGEKDISLPKVTQGTRIAPKRISDVNKDKKKNGLRWEDLENISNEFDPKQLILLQDQSDKEDEYYLQEYAINSKRMISTRDDQDTSIIQANQKGSNQIAQKQELSNLLTSENKLESKESYRQQRNNVRPWQQNKSVDMKDSRRKHTSGTSPTNLEILNLEKQNQIYRAFLNQQSYKERMVNKKKMIIV